MVNLSICIPTYNRGKNLKNCLNSIRLMKKPANMVFEICISDNCSTDSTSDIVYEASKDLSIRYCKNESNLGIPANFVNVINMASGEFCWLIGDDDLLVPESLNQVELLFKMNPGVDFFYVNSFHLTTEFVLSHPQPFDTINLPTKMETFSKFEYDGQIPFIDLINPKISFDFLGGMYLSIFRRKMWIDNVDVLNKEAIVDKGTFSHFDNTFPHVKIFATAFSNSLAYFNATPLSVSLSGTREWAPMYPFIRSVRLIESLDIYRKNGLSWKRYVYAKNYSLRYFIPDMVYILIYPKKSGLAFINFRKHILANIFYLNLYLSPFYFFLRKFTSLFILKNRKK